MIALAWTGAIATLAATDWLFGSASPFARMLALCGATLFAMKLVVTAHDPCLPPGRWLLWATGWPGMRPDLFAARRRTPGGGRLIGAGLAWILMGLAMVGLARALAPRSPWAATLAILPGLSLILHFGILKIAAGAWRLAGFDCKPLFHAPLLSRSLTEFWGRRWNIAFTEMARRVAYGPVASRFGRNAGLFAAFALSAALHEAVISLPVRAGYGLPTLYFLLHGALVACEGGRTPGRLWTLAWLAAPLPLLFHPAFLRGAIWPLLACQ